MYQAFVSKSKILYVLGGHFVLAGQLHFKQKMHFWDGETTLSRNVQDSRVNKECESKRIRNCKQFCIFASTAAFYFISFGLNSPWSPPAHICMQGIMTGSWTSLWLLSALPSGPNLLAFGVQFLILELLLSGHLDGTVMGYKKRISNCNNSNVKITTQRLPSWLEPSNACKQHRTSQDVDTEC